MLYESSGGNLVDGLPPASRRRERRLRFFGPESEVARRVVN